METLNNKKTSVRTTGNIAEIEKTTEKQSSSKEQPRQVFDLSVFEVREGMVNLTKIAKSFGKDTYRWRQLKSTQDFLRGFEETYNTDLALSESDYLSTKVGGNGEQGTFACREIALEFARWISPKFAVWANKQIDTLLQTGRVELKPSLPELPLINADFMQQVAERMKALEVANAAQTVQIQFQAKELEHKQEIIMDRIADIPPQTMRTKLNKICRWTEKGDFEYRWRTLYKEFKYTYGFNLKERAENAKMSILDYAEKFGCLEDLYNLALKLFETEKDGRQLILS